MGARNGVVYIQTEGSYLQDDQLAQKIRGVVEKIPGVREVQVSVLPSPVYD